MILMIVLMKDIETELTFDMGPLGFCLLLLVYTCVLAQKPVTCEKHCQARYKKERCDPNKKTEQNLPH